MHTRFWLACSLTALVAFGCSPDPGPEPVTTETPEPVPEPEPVEHDPPPPDDVAGTVDEVAVVDLSTHHSGLHHDGSEPDAPVPVDEDAVEAVVDAAVTWVDAHLTDVQAGGDGAVVDGGLDGEVAAASTAVTGPDHPVTEATYVVTVGALGAPEWVRVSSTVARADGATSTTYVFLPDGDQVTLLAVHTGDGTPVPAQGAAS